MDTIQLQDALEKAYNEANEYLGVFGAEEVTLNITTDKYGIYYYLHYWKKKYKEDLSNSIFLSVVGNSFQEAISKCHDKAGIEYKSLVK